MFDVITWITDPTIANTYYWYAGWERAQMGSDAAAVEDGKDTNIDFLSDDDRTVIVRTYIIYSYILLITISVSIQNIHKTTSQLYAFVTQFIHG